LDQTTEEKIEEKNVYDCNHKEIKNCPKAELPRGLRLGGQVTHKGAGKKMGGIICRSKRETVTKHLLFTESGGGIIPSKERKTTREERVTKENWGIDVQMLERVRRTSDTNGKTKGIQNKEPLERKKRLGKVER